MSLLAELKRRNVFRVGAAYIVAAWLGIEVASVVTPAFSAPEWVLKIMIVFAAIGFPVAVIFSWAYELTPEGVKRERDVNRDQSITHNTGRKLDITTIAMVVVAVGFVLFERLVWIEPATQTVVETRVVQADSPGVPSQQPPATKSHVSDDRISVAVLPFLNMSSDPEQDYFSDGISEELLNVLVKLESLRVPSRTSSFAFKDKNLSIGEIARQLNVAHVLEGSVRKAGNQVRVTAQLIDVDSDTHLWSETYTRQLDDIFAIQDEIANAIVEALKITLNAGENLAFEETGDSLAYNQYLKGRYFWHQRTQSGSMAAERELRAAVDLDPGFALAWAALADVYVLQPEYLWSPIDVAIPKARAALERALILNAESARALTTRAYLRHMYDWDHAGAEVDFLQAIEIDPNYATAHQWYAEYLNVLRRRDQALEQALIAVELDPLAPVKPLVVGNVLRNLGRPDEANVYYEQALELVPEWFPALRNMVRTLVDQGQFDAALQLVDHLDLSLEPEARFDPMRVSIKALAGEAPVDQAIDMLLATEPRECTASYQPAWLAALGAYDESISMLERCIENGDPYVLWVNTMPEFESMRSMPRFQALLARVNLPVADSDQ